MKFIDNWQDCWKWISTQCFAAIAALGFAMAMLPADYRAAKVMTVYTWLNVVLGLLGAFGRNVQQTPQSIPTPSEPTPAPGAAQGATNVVATIAQEKP